jgi:hypothetical protein
MIYEDETAAEVKNGSKSQLKTTTKKGVASNLQSTISSQKTGPSHSDGGSKSAGIFDVPDTLFTKPKPKLVLEDLVEEANSRRAIVTRSHSNPKERTTQLDKQARKRLSLPNSG